MAYFIFCGSFGSLCEVTQTFGVKHVEHGCTHRDILGTLAPHFEVISLHGPIKRESSNRKETVALKPFTIGRQFPRASMSDNFSFNKHASVVLTRLLNMPSTTTTPFRPEDLRRILTMMSRQMTKSKSFINIQCDDIFKKANTEHTKGVRL